MVAFLLLTHASIGLTEDSDPRQGREMGREEDAEEQGVLTWLILRLAGWAWWVFTPDSLSLSTIL